MIYQDTSIIAMIQMGIHIPKKCIIVARLRAESQAGERLAATIDTISRSIDDCQIYLADTLDIHLCGSRPLALSRGEDWIQENRKYLGRFASNIIRWDAIKGEKYFHKRLAWFKHLYNTDGDTRFHIDQYCHRAVERIFEHGTSIGQTIHKDKLFLKLLNYRFEELAGLSVIRSWTDAPEICPAGLIHEGLTVSSANRNLILPQALPVSFQETASEQQLSLVDDDVRAA